MVIMNFFFPFKNKKIKQKSKKKKQKNKKKEIFEKLFMPLKIKEKNKKSTRKFSIQNRRFISLIYS